MKQILITSILALFLSTSVNAQKKATIPYYSTEFLDELKATPEQKEKIAEAVKEANSKSQVIKKDKSLSEDERKVKLKEVISERAKIYYQVLTPEQKAKIDQMKKELAEKNASM